MKKDTLKNLTYAHSWLGLIISGVLMIVFVCGSLSFYRSEIHQWDRYHNYHKNLPDEVISISSIIEQLPTLGYDIPEDHSVGFDFPSQTKPFYSVFFSIDNKAGEHQRINLNFSAHDGKLLDLDQDQFFLADLLYRMHVNLYMPAGREFVGMVSLLFFVVLLSGLLIHLKKMVSHYYQYRTQKSKDIYLDGHNLIGVTAFPYTLMYALTGVLFNLGIVFQVTFGLAAYQGDFERMAQELGFSFPPSIEASNIPLQATKYDQLLNHIHQQYPQHTVTFMYVDGLGDQASQAEVSMRTHHDLHEYERLTFNVADKTLIHGELVANNPASATTTTFETLHYGSFGGDISRAVMFILGLACCYLILTGNLIWLEKRANSRKQNPKSMRFVYALTLALSSGILISVAMCFTVTRFFTDHFSMQNILVPAFHLSWLLAFVHAYFLQVPRRVMVQQLRVAALLFISAPAFDLISYSISATEPLPSSVLGTNLVLISMALFCIKLSLKGSIKRPSQGNKQRSEVQMSPQ